MELAYVGGVPVEGAPGGRRRHRLRTDRRTGSTRDAPCPSLQAILPASSIMIPRARGRSRAADPSSHERAQDAHELRVRQSSGYETRRSVATHAGVPSGFGLAPARTTSSRASRRPPAARASVPLRDPYATVSELDDSMSSTAGWLRSPCEGPLKGAAHDTGRRRCRSSLSEALEKGLSMTLPILLSSVRPSGTRR
jgi:hypothetical protein